MRAGPAGAWKWLVVAALLVVATIFAALRFDPAGGLAALRPGPPRPLSPPERSAQPCLRPSGLIVPVQGVQARQLADTFSQARSGGHPHDAIDIMAPTGTPVLAAAAGTVEKLFLSKAGGKTVYVRLVDGRAIHYYAHLDAYTPGLHQGMRLMQGAPIGTVGYTGNANPAAPHLHFAVLATDPARKWWEKTRAINPYPLLAGHDDKCGTEQRR